jgi:hypothetical protein
LLEFSIRVVLASQLEEPCPKAILKVFKVLRSNSLVQIIFT